MPKIYFYNGKILTTSEGGITKILTTASDFRFTVITDTHGQIDIISRVFDGIIDNSSDGTPGEFLWITDDIS